MRMSVLATTVVFALTACNFGGSDIPQVAERYQEGIDLAWERADRGESPTSQCARVTGTAVGMASSGDNGGDNGNGREAAEAYQACYSDVHAHWIKRRIELAEAGQPPCLALMTGMVTTRMSLGSFASQFELTLEGLDDRLNSHVGDLVVDQCPDQSGLILGRAQ